MNRKSELYEQLEILDEERKVVLKKIAVMESKTCRQRFSSCLDCRHHNGCPRYFNHIRETE